MSRFLERLQNGPAIVGDGGMGALISSAVPRLRTPEEANIRAPDAVVSLHVSFINAGAELIETNTFGANRRKLAAHFLEDELERINSTAVKLAREAREITGRDVFIAGSIGPLGEQVTTRVRRELFAEQATILEGRGADLFMVETFYDLDELVDAIEAVRERLEPPDRRAAHLRRGAETLAGVTAREAADAAVRARRRGVRRQPRRRPARRARRARGDGQGRTCRSRRCRTSASRAWRAGASSIPHATPEYFAEFAAHARDLGARLIGGCCGTTPAEIAAIHSAVAEDRKPRAPLVVRRARARRRARRRGGRDGARPRATGGRVRRLGRSSTRRSGANVVGLVEVAQALKDSGQVGVRRRQRQRDGARAA